MTNPKTKHQASADETLAELFGFIAKQGNSDYLGEQTQRQWLGALLHDVGRFIPAADKMPPMIALDGTYVGNASHEVVGERYLRQLGFSEKICQLVGAHVMAKRYLTAVGKNYYDGLSQSSKTTLKFQGGPCTAQEVVAAQQDPWLESKLAVRRWDDQAKDPNLRTPSLWSFRDMAVESLSASRTTGRTEMV
ncbi:hypothetical protein EJ03DRAFT_370536 [Teratosphaeria nubilosa]|uniref:HD domain-containing protein n=1 Tax=Teratosphaeria nubilosa TaxID=161662 RepID=A0A6G1LPV2_9PEZI|nr:hypothetical protein EJ03DRAFT_370536 [Teratosphaeria nubilosa]